MIRKATRLDLDQLMYLTKSCAQHMISQGIFQWNEHYPSREAFELDLEREELFVLQQKDQIVGCIVISTLKDTEYDEIDWLTPDGKNYYIHRLAVHPQFQGKGMAQRLMSYAENRAIEQAYRSIRLDTFSKNGRNQKFYELRGYKRLGSIYFPRQSEAPFYCYELVL